LFILLALSTLAKTVQDFYLNIDFIKLMSHLIFRKSLYLFYSTRYKYYNYIVQCHYTNMKYPFCILLIVALIYILFLYIKLLIMQHLVEQCIEIYYRLTCLYTCRTYLLTLEYILLQHSNLNRKTCQNPKRQNDIHNQPRSQALYFRFPPNIYSY
jgi:hypothetical protein